MFTPDASGGSSNGSSGKNYIAYPDFENNATTGWSLGTATLTNNLPSGAPTFGSGANGNLSIAVVSGSNVAGNYCLNYATAAASTAGNFLASDEFTIDPEDKGKVLTIKFSYTPSQNASNMNFSGTSSNSFGVAIYDTTNSLWVIPAGCFNLVQSSGVGICVATFQTGVSNTQKYRLVVYNANATAGLCAIYLDSFSVGPQVVQKGPAMSDWTAYTPTIGGTTSAPTPGAGYTQTAYWRRVGSDIEIRFTYSQAAVGSAGSGAYLIPLPSGMSIDTSQVTLNSTAAATTIGSGTALGVGALENTTTGSANFSANASIYAQSSTNLVVISDTGVIGQRLAWGSGNYALTGNPIYATFFAKVPISGWSSNSVQSSDTDTRVVAFRATSQPTGTVNSSVNIATFTSPQTDTHAAFSAGTYTVPVSGQYQIQAALEIDGTFIVTQNAIIYLYKNGSEIARASQLSGGSIAALFPSLSVTGLNLLAGDALTIRSSTTAGGSPGYGSSNCFFSLNRLSGPAVVTATESVGCKYTSSTTSVGTSATTIIMPTKVYDSHNAYSTSTGLYTVPVSGTYAVSCKIRTAGETVASNIVAAELFVQKNATDQDDVYLVGTGGTAVNYCHQIYSEVQCLAGDTIGVKGLVGTAGALTGSATFNTVTIRRVGNQWS